MNNKKEREARGLNPFFIFLYSIGLALVLTGGNFIADLIPINDRLMIASFLLILGVAILFFSIYFLYS